MKLRQLFCTSLHSSKDYIKTELEYGCQNYAPLPVVLQSGKGVWVTDVEGKQYIDFLSSYSALNQGHCHPRILDVFIKQAQSMTLTSRAVHNDQLSHAYRKLHTLFGYDKALLMNTGVEIGESAIKFARRWGYVNKKVPDDKATVLFAKGNFWGRTIAACASSDDPDRFRHFGPFKGLNFELIDYDSIPALEKALRANPNIVAYMVEPIQGEKGVVIPKQGYLKETKQMLEAHNALLICDEVQTGLGRTGKMLCSDHENVRPDIVLLGKALSGGFYPISALLCDDKIMGNIKPGEHGSTYGGNPLACATLCAALDVIVDEKLCQHSAVFGAQLKTHFQRIFKGPHIRQVRGKGLFLGVEFTEDDGACKLSHILLKNGLIAKPTQKNIIRFAPPLIIKQDELNLAVEIIEKSWQQCESTL